MNRNSISRRYILLFSLVAFVAIAVGYWTTTCPCDRTPGFVLLGDFQEDPVFDWSFANNIPLCQIQIGAGIRPHAVNLNCMATPAGELYLSCSVCTAKYWASHVTENERAQLRLEGKVYPVVLNRVVEDSALDNAWRARIMKLQTSGGTPYNPTPPIDAERPDNWWSFKVVSRRTS
jgi:hypothetical protein